MKIILKSHCQQLLLLLLLTMIACPLTYAQALRWENLYNPGVITDVVEVPGGYTAASFAGNDLYSGPSQSLKVGLLGSQAWQNEYPSLGFQTYNYSLTQTFDGGYAIVGQKFDPPGFAYVIRTDSIGDTLWIKPIDFGFYNELQAIVQLPDSGFIVAGKQNSDVFAARLNSSGDTLWTREYPTFLNATGYAMKATSDGNFVIGGNTNLGIGDVPFLFKMNINGDTLWTGFSIAFTNPSVRDLIETQDGGFVLGGGYISSGPDAFAIKFSSTGTELWAKSFDFGAVSPYEDIYGLDTTLDGNIIAAGTYSPSAPAIPGDTSDAFILKLDPLGNEIWRVLYNDTTPKGFRTIIHTSDGGYLAGGFQKIDFSGALELLIKTDSLGQVELQNYFAGTVYYDANGNCVQDPGEIGLPYQMIEGAGPGGPIFTLPDTNGSYALRVDTGTYNATISPVSSYFAVSGCASPVHTNTFSGNYETVSKDFPLTSLVNCPGMWVDLSTPFLRFCNPGTYFVDYCNFGTQPDSGTITLTFDSLVAVTGSSVPWNLPQSGNTYVFEVGEIGVMECGQFTVGVDVSCDFADFGRTSCVTAEISPDSICQTPSPSWDQSSVEVEIECMMHDSVRFTIRNVGVGNMLTPGGWSVIEDNIMRQQGTFQLGAGLDTMWTLATIGGTWYLEADQSPFHPGNSQPRAAMEGCGSGPLGSFSTGFLLSYPQDDGNPFVSIDCQEIIGSYDPNDKMGFPSGAGIDHLIQNDYELEYRIRFQNLGTDTAFKVIILDTLPPYLDITTVRSGASSHPYTFEVIGSNVLKWTFDPISLVDSATNEAESNGFVKFRINQLPGNADGTRIENSAAIYFDFNPPVITNTYFHTIGTNFLITFTPNPIPDQKNSIKLYPNPIREEAIIELEGERVETLQLRLTDLSGNLVLEKQVRNENRIRFRNEGFAPGLYFYTLSDGTRLLGSGKVVVHP